MTPHPWDRVSFGGIEIPALSVSLRDNAAPPVSLGRSAGSYSGTITFEMERRDFDDLEAIFSALGPLHPTDMLTGMADHLYRSLRPEDIETAMEIRRRWAKRIRRRVARRGTIGRRGSRADG